MADFWLFSYPGSRSALPSIFLTLLLLFQFVDADGTGVLGAGKWLYRPVCAHACRRLINASPLLCQEHINGTDSVNGESVEPTPECHLMDAAYMRTLSLCIEKHCPDDHEPPRLSDIEDYWEGHLATGSVGDRSGAMAPIRSYSESLRLAHDDMHEIGMNAMLTAANGEPINQTMLVDEGEYQTGYNGLWSFQEGEFVHGRNSLAVAITTCAIPILASLLRFLPAHFGLASRIAIWLNQPFMGRRHRIPVPGNLGIMPTRGQSLFIAYIIVVNIVLGVAPIVAVQPNHMYATALEQRICQVGDRTGVISMANFVALFLFSSRNNVLLWITDWSHGTFLLLHRWVAYCCVMQALVHSVLLLYAFDHIRDQHAEESQLPYWYWGIIATLALCVMWPAALLPVRRRMYQLFLSLHQVLAALVLTATFLHIWFLFEYDWGYEIWVYVAGGIWFLDRLLRVTRVAGNGLRTATVTPLGDDGEYLRVRVEGIAAEGHVYVYFPTLSWRFWESHPFSVLSSFTGTRSATLASRSLKASEPGIATPDPEKNNTSMQDELVVGSANGSSLSNADAEADADAKSKTKTTTSSAAMPVASSESVRPCITLLLKPQDGATRLLAVRGSGSNSAFSLPMLVESSYDANPSVSKLKNCSTLLCIAGGVGITAVLPVARCFGGVRARLCWGLRSEELLKAAESEIAQLGDRVSIETSVGARLDLAAIVREELLRSDERGDVGIVVCGPPAMADDVRVVLGEVAGSGLAKRGVVFIDEAFSW